MPAHNLSVEGGRLRRHRDKDTAALLAIQQNRERQEKARLDAAAREYMQAVHENRNHGSTRLHLRSIFNRND